MRKDIICKMMAMNKMNMVMLARFLTTTLCVFLFSLCIAQSAETVRADPSKDGSFVLLPRAAKLKVCEIQKIGVRENIGWLDKERAQATWTLDVNEGGKYRVECLYTMPGNAATKGVIETKEGRLIWNPEPTPIGQDYEFCSDSAGIISLKKGEETLKFTLINQDGWMNLAEIRLIPAVALPPDILKFAKAYHEQKAKIDQDLKEDYMGIIRKKQKALAEQEKFGEIPEWEKEAKRVGELSAAELFGKTISGKCPLAGRWFPKGSNEAKIEISGEGRVVRQGKEAGFANVAPDGKSCEFTSSKDADSYTYAKWTQLDEHTYSEEKQGSTLVYERKADGTKNPNANSSISIWLNEYSGKWTLEECKKVSVN